MTLHRGIFWLHLVTGVVCGLVIALMAATGAAVAYDTEIIGYAQREVARVEPAAPETPRASLEDILKSVRRANPDTAVSGVVVYSDPAAATMVMMGRDKPAVFANPVTGELKEQNAAGVRAFMKFALELHRWLALGGDGKAVGQLVTGSCALAFLVLSLSGLWLWWPRDLSWKRLRPSTTFIRGARGKARDWNWHNVVGFWSLPLLIILSSTGVMMSFRWAGNFLYLVAGEQPPAAQNMAGESVARIAPPEPDSKPVSYDALLAVAQKEVPAWESVSFRMAGGKSSGAKAARPQPAGMDGRNRETDAIGVPLAAAKSEAGEAARASGETKPRSLAPVSVTVRRADALPLTALVTLTLNPFTGEVIKREGFSDKTLGNKLRGSVRAVHTGEGFGPVGQTVALVAAFSALTLVYTGLALAWRRFFPGKKSRHHQHREDGKQPSVFGSGHAEV